MDDIYSFLNPNSNDVLSKMNASDYNDLRLILDKTQLELRDNLGLNENVTFGMEFESEEADTNAIIDYLEQCHLADKLDIKADGSLNNGLEIATPIYTDKVASYKQISIICDVLKKYAIVGDNCGGHIHIGAHIIENIENLANLLYLWMVYEDLIFRFTNGEFLTARPNLFLYAAALRNERNSLAFDVFNLNMKEFRSIFYDTAIRISNITNLDKRRKRNTIEFRCPNGTFEPVIWQNNLNLFVKMIEFVKSDSFDIRMFDSFKYDLSFYDMREYDIIYYDKVLEFVDLVFKNNKDKIYFLRQYFKNNGVSRKYIKAERFVR